MSLTINTNMNSIYTQLVLAAYSESLSNRLGIARIAESGINEIVQLNTSLYAQGMSNANQGISMVQTATAGVAQTQSILQQMSTLATESASGVLSSSQLTDLQSQYSQLQSQVNYIANTTSFNGISLLQNTSGSIDIQVSPTQVVTVDLPKTDTTSLGIASTDISTASDATTAMTSITKAIKTITSDTADLGASQLALQIASIQDRSMVSSLVAESTYSSSSDASIISQTGMNSLMNQVGVMMLARANSTSLYALHLLLGYQQDVSANSGSFFDLHL